MSNTTDKQPTTIEELNAKVDQSFADQKEANELQAKTNEAVEKAIDELTQENLALADRVKALEEALGATKKAKTPPKRPSKVTEPVTINKKNYVISLAAWRDGVAKVTAESLKGNPTALKEQLEKYPHIFIPQ